MRLLIHVLVVLGFLLVSLSVVSAIEPPCTRFLEKWADSHIQRDRTARLEAEREAISARRIQMKAVLDRLIREEITLRDAIESYRLIHQGCPEYLPRLRQLYHNSSDEFVIGNDILGDVKSHLWADPQKWEEIHTHLEEELATPSPASTL